MSQTAALILLIVIYGGGFFGLCFLGYWLYKKITKPKTLSYTAMPKLSNISETQLPLAIRSLLDDINTKGEKLRTLYGDTNNDGKIDNNDAKNETFVIVNKLLDEHIGEAVADYQRLNDLGDKRTETQQIGQSGVTGEQALLDILTTINNQFDDLLDAAYQSNAQKLLVTNRYLKSRFDA